MVVVRRCSTPRLELFVGFHLTPHHRAFCGVPPHAPQGSAAPLTPCWRRDHGFSKQRLCRLKHREHGVFDGEIHGVFDEEIFGKGFWK